MAEKIKKLLDELAAVVAEMNALVESDEKPAEADAEGGDEAEEKSADDDGQRAIEALAERAEQIKSKIEFYERVAEKEKELRSVLERGAPASAPQPQPMEEAQVEEKRSFIVPASSGKLTAFKGEGAEERAYKAGMFLKGHCFGDSEARRWCSDHDVRAQAGSTNSAGGFLVPDILSSEIIRLVEEFGAFPQYARRVPMTSDTLLIARRTGGLAARAVGENAEVVDSDMTFDNVQLNAKIWGVANRTPNSLMEDSVVNLADALATEVAQAFAEAFDNAGFIGDGTSTYHSTTGICTKVVDGNHSASVQVAETGNTTFGSVDLEDFTDAVAKLPLYARRNAAWYISPAGYGSAMLRLAMASGGNTRADVAGGFELRFLGFPVRLVHSMESALTSTESSVLALFGDLSQAATFGERRAVSIRTASERYIEYDQTLTFATTRNAMVVHDLGSTSKAGPIVALQAAAS
ncbi:MAG: phage major capsid protein [Pirellulales bacterium]